MRGIGARAVARAAAAALVVGAVAFVPASVAVAQQRPTTVTVSISEPAEGAVVGPGPVTVRGTAAVGDSSLPPDTALVLVVDISGSTASGCATDTILGCEITAGTGLLHQAALEGSVGSVAVVAFATTAGAADLSPPEVYDNPFTEYVAPGTDANHDGAPDTTTVLLSLDNDDNDDSDNDGGIGQFTPVVIDVAYTNFPQAVTEAKRVAAAMPQRNKLIVFMSDGLNNGGSVQGALEPITDTVVFRTFAVGAGASCGETDNPETLAYIGYQTHGGCDTILDPTTLPDVLPGVVRSSLDGVFLTVDGGPEQRIDVDGLPHSGPYSTPYEATVNNLAPGAHRLCVIARGKDLYGNGTATQCRSITVNRPPVVDPGGPYEGLEDTEVPIAGTFTDQDGPRQETTWSISPAPGTDDEAECGFADPEDLTTTVHCDRYGTYVLTLDGTDGISDAEPSSTTLVLRNAGPEVDAGGPYTGQEDTAIALLGTVEDPDSPELDITWSLEPPTDTSPEPPCTFTAVDQLSTSVTCAESGTYTLVLTVDDGVNPPVSDRARLTVTKAPVPQGALSVGLTADPVPGYVGGLPVTVTYTVRNGGPVPMAGVQLTAPAPAGLAAGTPAGCPVVCALGTLAPGQVVQVQAAYVAAAAIDVPVTATVTTTGPDIDPADNTATGRVVVRQPVLRVDPSAGPQGAVTNALGTDFPPGATVRLSWDTGISETPGVVAVRPDGTFTAQVLVFHKDVLGPRLLAADPVTGAPFGRVATAQYTVMIRSLKPVAFVLRGDPRTFVLR
ncbi:hypothetical protein [Actinokineospora globicatena]|uniref:hypothetical protein n=1 Tax=Actinokineospora globicatena TaxID=103729 RepID=UPI0024A5A461|nr:hypothetical protein [Actinokineospora globicatena]MCP2306424.1 von Willebrand factor type A domain-containing protein [Actinokineospora globicatena]GLW81848.1 hypothetical protein Aglo01_63290 [Actinokineospora globicatena]GLW88642.1 hypothetical protein Aglo02_62810 [Actinokineospora globicatena]